MEGELVLIAGEGKPWFPREHGESEKEWLTKLLEYDELYSRASEKVESIINENANRQGFKKILRNRQSPFFSVPYFTKRINGKWDAMYDKEEGIGVGTDFERDSPKVYMVWPDLVSSFVEWGAMHENSHTKGQDADITREAVELAIEKYGTENFYALSEGTQRKFVYAVHRSDPVSTQCDLIANEQVVQEYRKAGLGNEELVKKIAPVVWFAGHDYCFDKTPANEREEYIRTCAVDYVDRYLPQSVPKDEITNEVIKIDREYQKRLSEHPLAKRALRS